MTREMEERIVAMYFNNEDFEKNARTTINTLGELKNSLNMEEAAKGFDVMEKISKNLNFSRVTQTVRSFKTQLDGIGKTFKKVFDVATIPLRPFENLFNTINGYATKYLGFDLARKIVSSVEGAIRSITVAPVQEGWQMYQSNMDSVKTIMSGTMQSYAKTMSEANANWAYNEGEHMDFVKEKLADLTEYANKTIFSLQDMTSNVGKFTNNNVDLETAVTAMKGIANATADAGQGAAEASRAMYNISQAIGMGKMMVVDWRSLENANIATAKLKDTFIEMGVSAGTVDTKVVEENGKKITKYFAKMDEETTKKYNKMNKKQKEAFLKEREITAENFRETLKDDWLNKDVMLRTFQIFSGELPDMNTLMSWAGGDEELVKHWQQIGQEASKAATEVRTFKKMWDALKEAAQSGWARSMELIFGDVREATKLWTSLNDIFSGIVEKSSANRRKVLLEWRGLEEAEDGTLKRIKGQRDGRADLIAGVEQIIYAMRDLGEAFGRAWEAVFGKLDGNALVGITKGFKDFAFQMRNWLGISGKTGTRLEKIQKIAQGFFSVLKIGARIVRGALNIIWKIAKPLVEVAIDGFSVLGEWLTNIANLKPGEMFKNIGDGLGKLWEKIKKWFTPQELTRMDGSTYTSIPLLEKMHEIWDAVKEGLRLWANENGLGNVVEIFDKFGESFDAGWQELTKQLGASWDAFKNSDLVKGIGEFLTNTWSWFTGLFQRKEKTHKKPLMKGKDMIHFVDTMDGEKEYEDPPIITWLYDIRDKIVDAWNAVVGWEGWDRISLFFNDIKTWISTQFGIMVDWFKQPDDSGETGFSQWIDTIRGSLETSWSSFVNSDTIQSIAKFASDAWGWVSGLFTRKEKTHKKPLMKGKDMIHFVDTMDGEKEYTDPPIITWLLGIYDRIVSAWNALSEELAPVWTGLATMFSDVWKWIQDNYSVAVDWMSKPNEDGETGLSEWLGQVKTKLEGAWNGIASWEGWAQVKDFFIDTWNWIISFFEETGETEEKAAKAINTGVTKDTEEKTEEKIDILGRVAELIGGLFDRIAGALGSIAGIPSVQKFLNGFTGVLDGILNILGIYFGHLADVLHGEGNTMDWLITLIPVVLLAAVKLFDFFNNKNISKITMLNTQSVGAQFFEIATGFMLISVALSLLSAIDQKKMWMAVGAITVIGFVIAAISALMTKMNESKTASLNAEKETALERVGMTFIKWAGVNGILYILMTNLPTVLEAFDKFKGLGDDIFKTVSSFTILIGGLMLISALVTKVFGMGKISMKETAQAFGNIAIWLVGFTVLIGGLGTILGGIFDTKDVVKVIREGGEILREVGKAVFGFVSGIFGIKTDEEKIEEAGSILTMLGRLSDKFNLEQISGMTRMMILMQDLSQTSKGLDSSKLAGFGTAMSSLGSGLATFYTWTNEFVDEDNYSGYIQKLNDGVDLVGKMATALKPLMESDASVPWLLERAQQLSRKENLEPFIQNIQTILDGLGGLKTGNNINFDGITIVSRMYDAIQEGLDSNTNMPKFRATKVTDALIAALLEAEESISSTVHNVIQNGIDKAGSPDGEGNFTLPENLTGINLFKDMFKLEEGATPLSMDQVVNSMFGGLDMSTFGDTFSSVFADAANKIPDLSKTLDQKGWNGNAVDENGQAVDMLGNMDQFLAQLNEKVSAIEDIEIKIVPVIDMTNWDKERAKLVGMDPTYMPISLSGSLNVPKANVDLDGAQYLAELRELNFKMGGLIRQLTVENNRNVDAINGMSGRITDVSRAIANLKLYLDTGLLVGGITPMIDRELYNRSVISERTGVTPAKS